MPNRDNFFNVRLSHQWLAVRHRRRSAVVNKLLGTLHKHKRPVCVLCGTDPICGRMRRKRDGTFYVRDGRRVYEFIPENFKDVTLNSHGAILIHVYQ